jgi:hypothetical protein
VAGDKGRRGLKGTPKRRDRPSGKRLPARSQNLAGDKTPRLTTPPHESGTLVWRFNRLDFGGDWGWGHLTQGDVASIHERCANWEQMRTGEIFGQAGNKHIPLENLCGDAQKRLKEIEADDLDGLWELRLGGKKRIWGTRSEHVFDLIWWDPKHTVCPSRKRNT